VRGVPATARRRYYFKSAARLCLHRLHHRASAAAAFLPRCHPARLPLRSAIEPGGRRGCAVLNGLQSGVVARRWGRGTATIRRCGTPEIAYVRLGPRAVDGGR
jgi:hypothetical protein